MHISDEDIQEFKLKRKGRYLIDEDGKEVYLIVYAPNKGLEVIEWTKN